MPSNGGQPQFEQPYGLKNTRLPDRESQLQLVVQCPQTVGSLSWNSLKDKYSNKW